MTSPFGGATFRRKAVAAVAILSIVAGAVLTLNSSASAGSLGGEPPDLGSGAATTYTAVAGSNTVTGTLGPTPTDGQDSFTVAIPATLEVTSVSFSGPAGPHNLVGCGLGGTSELSQTFTPPQSACSLSFFIATDFVTTAAAWTVTVNVQARPVVDRTPPVLTVPADMTAEITFVVTPVTFSATATDDIDSNPTVACTPASGAAFVLGPTTVTCTATDDAGNAASRSFLVTVVDTTPPEIIGDFPSSVEATGATTRLPLVVILSVDRNGVRSSGCSPSIGSFVPLGDTVITCTATDVAGNETSRSFTVTVVDTTGPTLTLPADRSATATGPAGALVDYVVSATDLVDPAPAVDCTQPSGSLFALGVTTVTCTATDAEGNESSGSFTVTVNDEGVPLLEVPANQTVEATGATGATVTYSVTATDDIDPAPAVECTPPSGSLFALGVKTVTCTATDASGNRSSSGSFTVTVTDESAPLLAVPANQTVEATGATGAAVTYSVTATDRVDPAPAVDCTKPSGSLFALGVKTVTCTATDVAGNETSRSFTVTVVDTTGPTLTLPADRSATATGPAGALVDYVVSATDRVNPVRTLDCTKPSGSLFALGVTTVTCTATDAEGNESSGSFTVTVTDEGVPLLEVPANQTVEATGATGAAVTYSVTATDDIDPAPAVECTPPSGSLFALGVTTVTCTATDAEGNESSGSFTVTVTDESVPQLEFPANQMVEATGATGATVTYSVTATDDIDPAPAVECTPPSGSLFALGATTVTCTATDAEGNESSGSFTVTVTDEGVPLLEFPANQMIEATGATGATVTYSVTATDDIDPAPAVECTPPSGSLFALGATTVTCTATDAEGNESSGSFTVTVTDEGVPLLEFPANQMIEATGATGATVTYSVTATDDIDPAPAVECTPPSGSLFVPGATTVTCTATDSEDNTSSGNFTVTVVDTTPPEFHVPVGLTATADGPDGAVVAWEISAADAVAGSVPVSCDHASGSLFPIGTTTVTCTASDAGAAPAGFAGAARPAQVDPGNIATATFDVTVSPGQVTPTTTTTTPRSTTTPTSPPPTSTPPTTTTTPRSTAAALPATR